MEKRKIYIGADSAGYELKEIIKDYITDKGYEVVDCGTDSSESCHYPEFASAVAKNVQKDLETSFGILICGTGIGMSIASNKHKVIRAGLCTDPDSAALTRQHNNANILCMGARILSFETVLKITDAFLNAEFLGGRHQRRVDMLEEI